MMRWGIIFSPEFGKTIPAWRFFNGGYDTGRRVDGNQERGDRNEQIEEFNHADHLAAALALPSEARQLVHTLSFSRWRPVIEPTEQLLVSKSRFDL
jgi:hypothetical protein